MATAVIRNPILWADVPDPDIIRVGSVFYMVSTSMHSMPGCPIMKSVNLCDWNIVNYVYETLEDNAAHRLQDGKGIYGKGSWAASLRYHDGVYYVCFSSNDMNRFYVYRTNDIENGPWVRTEIPKLFHDPALLFDDDGRVYVIHGNGDIRITELTKDAAALQPGGTDQLLLEGEREGISLRMEGCHAYKWNGYYYLFFIEWPSAGNQRRRQLCYRSRELLGTYERRVILDDDMGYRNKGIAQGGLVDTPEQDWYALLFQDHDAVGRIPWVLPVRWVEDWPVITGEAEFDTRLPCGERKPLLISDHFDYKDHKLALNWQWNHNPDNSLWSVTERPGWLRMYNGHLADSVLYARNTLTQRTEGPFCSVSGLLDFSGLQPGDRAGLVALQNGFGTVGVEAGEKGSACVSMCVNGGGGQEETVECSAIEGTRVYLRIDFQFEDSRDQADFYYSTDGSAWNRIGRTLQMKYTLDHFMGYRIGLYSYPSKYHGGYADWDDFRVTKELL